MPTLAVVSAPPGTGKTTLAQKIAQELGCGRGTCHSVAA
ncbi:AAA family ATPase [Streptomyces sp. 058-1L]